MDESALWDEIGRIHLRIASFDDAVTAFSKAIELNSNHAKYYSDLATAYCLKGRNIEAIALYHKCLELPGSDTEKISAWNKLADIYGRMNDYRNAAAAYARAAELSREASGLEDEDDAKHNGGSGNHQHNSMPSGSERNERSAPASDAQTEATGWSEPDVPQRGTRTDPGTLEQDPNLAKRLAAVEAAIAARMAAKAVAASPDKPDAAPSESLVKVMLPVRQTILGASARSVSMQVPALDALPQRTNGSSVTQAEPRTWGLVPTPALVSAEDDFSGGGQEDINRSIESAQEVNPSALTTLVSDSAPNPIPQDSGPENLALSNFEAGPRSYLDDPVEVQRLLNELATYRRITDIAPANDRAWDRIGRISKDLGQYADAIQAFQRAIEIEPGQADYQYHLGLVFAAQKRYEDAISAFLRTVEIDPVHILAHCAVAGCYVRLARPGEAQKHIDIARPEMETEKEYNRACFEAICGNVDLAIDLLRIALKSKQTTMTWVRCDPDLDFIRKDPRFQALVTSSETMSEIETGLG